jgi:peptidoglycan hydrolase-like protein with peptidoglycan-binding domain
MNRLTGLAKLDDQSSNVAELQRYLEQFGYFKFLPPRKAGLFETATQQALSAFQFKQGLAPTGELDEPTLRLINTPRCGIDDIGEYVLEGRKWGKYDLTYGFTNFTNDLSQNDIRSAVQQALGLWSEVSPLRFTEIPIANNPDIKIMFGTGNHGDNSPFDGPGSVLAHAFYPPPNGGDLAGDTHFDDSETWSITIPPAANAFDLVSVAAHEFGHALGLGHSSVSNSLMYAYYTGPHRYLHADDIAGIQTAYPRITRLVADGGELGQHLSHAFGDIELRPAYQGLGEAWVCRNRGNNEFSIECLGAEAGQFLSHAFGDIELRNGYGGAGEAWAFHSLGGNKISIECLGGERGRYLSHAFADIELRNYGGAGEIWINA